MNASPLLCVFFKDCPLSQTHPSTRLDSGPSGSGMNHMQFTFMNHMQFTFRGLSLYFEYLESYNYIMRNVVANLEVFF